MFVYTRIFAKIGAKGELTTHGIRVSFIMIVFGIKTNFLGGTYVSTHRIPAHPRDPDPDDGLQLARQAVPDALLDHGLCLRRPVL